MVRPISFLTNSVSVEDILSYGVKRKYQSYYRSKVIPASARVLQDLGKTLPEAAAVYENCFGESSKVKEDYVMAVTPTEKKVVWIRVALIEGEVAVHCGESLE